LAKGKMGGGGLCFWGVWGGCWGGGGGLWGGGGGVCGGVGRRGRRICPRSEWEEKKNFSGNHKKSVVVEGEGEGRQSQTLSFRVSKKEKKR